MTCRRPCLMRTARCPETAEGARTDHAPKAKAQAGAAQAFGRGAAGGSSPSASTTRRWPASPPRSPTWPAPAREIAVVIGGGNIFRGVAISAKGGDRVTGDHMGMLATVMNALALEAALAREGMEARALSAIEMPSICETYVHRRAAWHMSRKVHRRARRRHRQPVLHHRQRRGAARARAGMRRAPQGHAGRRRLFRRPAPRPECRALRSRDLPGGDLARASRSWIRPPLRLPATTDCR